VFARKLIRLYEGFSTDDLMNEINTIAKVGRPEVTDTIVEVLRYDFLDLESVGIPGDWAYIDMEYCSHSLEDYINGTELQDEALSGSTSPGEQDQTAGDNIQTEPPPSGDTLGKQPEEMEFDWEPVVKIMFDVTSGLVYLHDQRIVHRDLKPNNGLTRLAKNTLTSQYCFRPKVIVGS
jgi:serine/threonine protein kinase